MHHPVLCINMTNHNVILDNQLAATLISYSGDLFLMQWRAVPCPYLSSLSLHKFEIGKVIGYRRQP